MEVEEEHLYLDDGVITSAGVLAGAGACLHVLRRDHGQAVANSMAQFLVSAPHRQGDHARFIEAPVASDDSNLVPLLEWLAESLAEALTSDSIARHAQLSVRTLSRRFNATTGVPLLAWITARRVERVRVLLQTTRLPVTEVAHACGFTWTEALRVHHTAHTRTSPSADRRASG